MGRNRNYLTATQKDEEAFGKLNTEIRTIGVNKLASYGHLSHESIRNYLRRDRGGELLEGQILKSLADHYEARRKIDSESTAKAQQVLATA